MYGTRGIISEVMKGEDGGAGRAQMIKSKEIENEWMMVILMIERGPLERGSDHAYVLPW